MKNRNNLIATFLGASTSVCIALGVIDWDTFDIHKHWPKLIIITVPAIGGYMSTMKPINLNKKKQDDVINP